MKLLKNSQSGQTMIMALILLALGGLLVVPLLNHSFTNLGHHQSIECRTLNSYSADSGVEYVLQKVYSDPGGYTTENLTESFPLNNRTVNVTAEYQGGGIYKITSKASGGGCGSTTITSYVNLSAGAFAYTVAAKESMTIENATVNSTDPGGASIHSNGDIDLVGGQVLVDGDATAVGLVEGDDVTGLRLDGASPIQFPGDYSELYKTMALEGENFDDNVTLDSGEPITFGPAYIDGNLTVNPGTFVTLLGTVYVTGAIEVKPRAHLDGEQNVVAEQGITIDGGEIISDYIPLIMSTGGDITVNNDIVNAVVYAPNNTVTLSSKVHLYGAVGGKIVDVNNATITYAAELEGRQDLPGGELSTIAYSYE